MTWFLLIIVLLVVPLWLLKVSFWFILLLPVGIFGLVFPEILGLPLAGACLAGIAAAIYFPLRYIGRRDMQRIEEAARLAADEREAERTSQNELRG